MRPRLVVLLFLVSGCTQARLGAPLCPNPVLLGPVDRVGGHRAEAAKTVSTVEGEVEDFVSVSQSTSGGKTTTTTTAYSTTPGPMTNRILMGTEGRAERDVRVDEVSTGAWVMFFGTYGATSQWAGCAETRIEGDIVKVAERR